jgi:hypothetical protein
MFRDFLGNNVDLDDFNTYPNEWKTMPICLLFSKCMELAGKSLFYMYYLHKDAYKESSQIKRVEDLCKELSFIWNYCREFKLTKEKYEILNEGQYRLLLMQWRYRFEDETENQC